jgi:hypothetical protein
MSSSAMGEHQVKLCYCDESGTGNEPIAVMTGIVVDASRMHLTKEHWADLLKFLSEETGHQIVELHTRNFYSGNDVFRGMGGPVRAKLITHVFEWLAHRKHHVVYAAVLKSEYHQAYSSGRIPDELNTIWRFLGFHLVLSMQKYCQQQAGVKGHTIFIFDNEERERMRFTDIIKRPPDWSDRYYDRKRKQEQLDQIVDVPYFGDSTEVSLIQLADFTSFFIRRYAEIKEGLSQPRYHDEENKINEWVCKFMERSIGSNHIYPQRGREMAHNYFYDIAPRCIRDFTE